MATWPQWTYSSSLVEQTVNMDFGACVGVRATRHTRHVHVLCVAKLRGTIPSSGALFWGCYCFTLCSTLELGRCTGQNQVSSWSREQYGTEQAAPVKELRQPVSHTALISEWFVCFQHFLHLQTITRLIFRVRSQAVTCSIYFKPTQKILELMRLSVRYRTFSQMMPDKSFTCHNILWTQPDNPN